MIRVLITDDQPLVRAGLVALLTAAPGLEVVAEAADGRQAVALAAQVRPDVVLMDIRMPVMNGIAATREILHLAGTPARVIILTTFDLDEYVYSALAEGASGVLLKDAPASRIVRAVHAVVDGDILLAPDITRRLVERYAPSPRPSDVSGLDELTAREREVLALVGEGSSNGEIARRLVVSEETVKTHVKRFTAKLQLTSRAQAVVVAYESGLVSPSSLIRHVPGGDPGTPGRRVPRN